MQQKNTSLARRYLFKLLANIASVPVYLVMEAVLPRALGPRLYGDYSFATNLFTQLYGFLDMGSSTCFYNALSRRQKEVSLIAFYMRVSILVLILLTCTGLLVYCLPELSAILMPGVVSWIAPFAALWAFMTWWGRVLRSMNDAIGETVPSELVRSSIALLALGVLLLLFFADKLNIVTLFGQQLLMLLATALGYWWVTVRYYKSALSLSFKEIAYTLPRAQTRSYIGEFYRYSNPLFVQALLAFFMLTLERWLLQMFEGSAEQGFFSLSQKVSMACFLFVSAITPLLMRELSIAWGKHDLQAMGQLINRFAPMLYVVAAYFSCFTFIEAPVMVQLFGGEQFMAAIVPVQIMALYPLHQGYGQLASSVFHASGKTKILRNMQMCECVYGLTTVWLLIAPAEYYGFGLGATGLAIKTVCIQMITVNIYLWLASRFVPLAFWRNVLHQIWSLVLLLAIAWLCHHGTIVLGIGDSFSLLRFLVAGIVYSLIVLGCVLLCPQLIGLQRSDVRDIIKRIRRRSV